MGIKAVLFDLDGTLLPMDMDRFTKGYFKCLAAWMAPYGYEPKQLVYAVWAGTKAMVANDGSRSNEAAFWERFSGVYGEEKLLRDKHLFDEFYQEGFGAARADTGFNPQAAETVRALKEMGLRVALATNPLFPAVATEARVRWAGLEPEDFELYTTYENISYCKPNPDYYREVLRRMALAPEECLMVGNDAEEDMIAETLGVKVFLLTDCLLNPKNRDVSAWANGGFDDLMDFVRSLTERRA